MNIVELLNQLNFTTLFLIFIVSKLFIETYLKTRNIKSINENSLLEHHFQLRVNKRTINQQGFPVGWGHKSYRKIEHWFID